MNRHIISLFAIFLSVFVIGQAQSQQKLAALSKQVKQAEAKGLPSEVLKHSERLVQEAIKVGNWQHTKDGIESYQGALSSLDQDREIEIFALLQQVWQGRKNYSPSERRWLALFSANRYLEQSNGYWYRSEGLGITDKATNEYIPRYWQPEQYYKVVGERLAVALEETDRLYEETDRLPSDDFNSLTPGRYFQLSYLVDQISTDNLRALEDRMGNYHWSLKIEELLSQAPRRGGAGLYAQYQLLHRQVYQGQLSGEEYTVRLERLIQEDAARTIEAFDIYETLFHIYRYKDRLKAYQLVEPYKAAIEKRYPKQAKEIADWQRQLRSPSWEVRTSSYLLPDVAASMDYKMVNTLRMTLRLYRVEARSFVMRRDILPGAKPIWQHEISGASGLDGLKELRGSVELPPLPSGHYRLIATPTFAKDTPSDERFREPQELPFTVSSITLLSLPSPRGKERVQCLDARTGQIRSGSVDFWRLHGQRLTRDSVLQPDRYGVVDYATKPNRWEMSYFAGIDGLMLPLYGMTCDETFDRRISEQQTIVQTDRAVYRPGQRVQFYVITSQINRQPSEAKLLSDKKLEAVLYDANHKPVDTLHLTTEMWGRASGNFDIPSDLLTGQYRLKVASGAAYFQVAEYKRPSFEVTVELPKQDYSVGNTLTATGTAKTYSGYPLTNAQVRYRWSGQFSSWGRYSSSHPMQVLASGTVKVDPQTGNFSLPLALTDLTPRSLVGKDDRWSCHEYTLTIDVTSPTGETQQIQHWVWLGSRPTTLSYEGASIFFTDQEPSKSKFTVKLLNADNEPIATSVQLSLIPVGVKRVPWVGNISSNEELPMPSDWRSLPSGSYDLRLRYVTSSGADVETTKRICLFSTTDQTIPADTTLWTASPIDEYTKTTPPIIFYGSREHEQSIFYLIKVADQLVQWGQLPALQLNEVGSWLPNLPKSIDPQGQVAVMIYTYREGKLYRDTHLFKLKQTPVKINVEWTKLRPRERAGATAEWQAKLTYSDGKPAANVPVALWMYDASLDAIQPHSIERMKRYTPMYLPTPMAFDLLSFPSSEGNPMTMNTEAYLYGARATTSPEKVAAVGYGSPRAFAKMSKSVVETENATEDGFPAPNETAPTLRSNFAETAFFIGDLTTDKDGLVTFSKTLPESLTRYKLCLYSYDDKLYDIDDTQTVETYREVMLEALMPRFIMQGDSLYLSRSVRNLSESDLSGHLHLQLLTPDSAYIYKESYPLTVGGQSTKTFSLPMPQIADLSAIRVRLFFDSGEESDGEEHLIPLLPNTTRVVESIPFEFARKTNYSYPLASLVSPKTQQSGNDLYIQLWANPLYFAVQQLPLLFNNDEHDAVNIAYRIYTLLLTKQLIAHPSMQRWIEKTREIPNGANKLQSNAETMLAPIEQTPWLHESIWVDGAHEVLWQLLHNPNKYDYRKDAGELSKLQNTNGDWSWFAGMPASPSLTPMLLDLMCQIEPLTQDNRDISRMIERGWKAYDKTIAKLIKDDKEWSKKHKQPSTLSHRGLEWLYLSLQHRNVATLRKNAETGEIIRYLEPLLLKDHKKLSLIDQAQAGLALHLLHHTDLATAVAASLRSHLTHEPAQGSFFANTKSSYRWYDRSMSLHRETIQLFDRLKIYSEEVNEMRRWAMEYLRTNLRAGTTSQAEMLLSLFQKQNNHLHSTDHVSISIPMADGTTQRVETDSYISIHLPHSQLDASKSVTVEHTDSEAILWGGLLSIGQRPFSEISERQGELMIEKEVSVQEIANDRTTLRPVVEDEQLSVGTILVTKLRITSRRDLDFVTIRDHRPACCEPLEQLSQYRWANGIGYYEEARDTAQLLHIGSLLRGSYEISYEQSVVRQGVYQRGTTQAQCAYATEYSAQTKDQGVWKTK